MAQDKANFLKETFERAWPSILNSCYKFGSKNPREDAEDLHHDLYIKYLNNLNKKKDIKLHIKSNEEVEMRFLYRKGNSQPEEVQDNLLNILQGQLINFIAKNDCSSSKTLEIKDFKFSINPNASIGTQDELSYEIYNEGKYELYSNNQSTIPDPIYFNVSNIQYSIQRAAINRSQDLHSNKNKRNKMYDDVVIESGSEIDGMENEGTRRNERTFRSNNPVEKRVIENIDQRRRMKMLKEYINTKMETKRSQVIHYFMQGLSYKEIASLMNISEGNARKLRYRAFIELEKYFKNKDKK